MPVRTPAGTDCGYYYEDRHRERDVEECRALTGERSVAWQPEFCARCPVPGILAANGSPDLVLTVTFGRGFLGMHRVPRVEASCSLHSARVEDPHVGCPLCNRESDQLLRELLDQK